jgi:hypothetical protein
VSEENRGVEDPRVLGQRMLELLNGYQVSAAIGAVTRLGMLAVVGGRERTAPEYGDLYAAAGFELTRILPLEPSAWSVIEGSPV